MDRSKDLTWPEMVWIGLGGSPFQLLLPGINTDQLRHGNNNKDFFLICRPLFPAQPIY
jgi:hypothetical protein